MATKNRSDLLQRAIESVCEQDYENLELVIVDDGSVDRTWQVLAQYQSQYNHILCLRNEKSLGIANARNKAIYNSTGELITGLDDDDYFLPHRISSLVSAYSEKYSFVCSATIWDWGNRRKIADGKHLIFGLSQQLSYNHASTQVLVNRQSMICIGGFDEQLVARVDYDAWTRLIERFGKAKRIPEATYVLNRDYLVCRVTSSEKNVIGNHQYFSKHSAKMNWRNRKNQEFWDVYARNVNMTLFDLFKQLLAGYPIIKIRYYIKGLLPFWIKATLQKKWM